MLPPIADRFVAGETPAEAIEYARTLRSSGRQAMLNKLGSHHDRRADVRSDVATYRSLAVDLEAAGIEAALSIKPSQIGLDLGEDVFRAHLEDVLETANERDVFVWLDMEESTTTDPTLEAFLDYAPEYGGGVGVCLQANLKRTREDVRRLADGPGKVRLVKGGAYDEPAEIAYRDRERMNRAYREVLECAVDHYDDGIAVASHDPEIIAYAKALSEECGTDVEFQMLMGVREDAQRELTREYDVSQYVPYGDRWKMYFFNRVTENRDTARFALRAVSGTI